MAIDSAEKRKSISGMAILMPGITPNSLKDQEWRQESGWNYSGIAAGGLILKTVIDGLFIFDTTFQDRLWQHTMTDTVFMPDAPVKQEDHLLIDTILSTDNGMPQSLRQLLNFDGLLLFDRLEKRLEKLVQDKLLLNDISVKQLQKLFADSILLGDSVITQKFGAVIELILTDGLLLRDILFKLQVGVLVDGMLITDNSVVQLSKVVSESLLFSDSIVKTLEQLQKEGLLLKDSSLVQEVKQSLLFDAIMLADLKLTEFDKVSVDGVLIGDGMVKLLTHLMADGMFMLDDVQKVVYSGIIAALIYARLQAVDLLNITYSSIDLLGRVIGTGPKPRWDS